MTHYPAHSRIYHIKADSLESKLNTGRQHSSPSRKTNNLKRENMNSLSGLLAHYDSDSEHEDLHGPNSNKLEGKVDDFLQEINKIIPNETSHLEVESQQKNTCAWQECFDDTTGYPYYWNVESNAVTWEMPEEYRNWLYQNSTAETKPPDKTTPAPKIQEIHKIKPTIPEKNVVKTTIPEKNVVKANKIPKTTKKNVRKKSIDSDDEKIVMITSYSEDSSSESEDGSKEIVKKEEINTKTENPVVMGPHVEAAPNKKEIIENVKEENIDETIILARLRTQAKVLHELGGELPKSLEKSIIGDIESLKPQSLALVAGYGDDSEPEEEQQPIKSLFPIPPPENIESPQEESQSTLFPISKPIDVKQFEIPSNKPQNYTPEETEIDNKVFKRKKRLGIAFDVIKPEKRFKTENEQLEQNGEERKGFGFQTEENSNDESKIVKSGIAFVKADTLNPVKEEKDISTNENENKLEDFEEIKDVVSEKVKFLGEGKDPVSAVQVMAIQLQTLELAFKAGGLTEKYLYSWLRETFVDLKKLEQDAAPEGWQCQWDRSNKRYFYRNAVSGEWQWEFPVEIVGGGDAMDICTTPPPNEEGENSQEHQPSPPRSSPTPPPPPPPVISEKTSTENIQPPIPSVPPPKEDTPPPPPCITVSENQPLPPGVDSPDLPFFASKLKETESASKNDPVKNDSLGSELDSFYSDIALLESTTTSGTSVEAVKTDIENVPSPSSSTENVNNDKKKRKLKPKHGQGANMKKKAVSTLVEKWKKVQNDYL